MRTSLLIFAAFVVAACSSPAEPGAAQQLDDGAHYFPAAEWRTATPAQVGMDATRISAMLRDVGSGRFGAVHSPMTRATLSALLLLLATAPALHAQQSAPPPACTGAEHKRFGFWAGEWSVFNLQNQQAGSSRVSYISNGCALLEEWQPANGSGGRSLNFFDRADQQWHQVWVGGDGTSFTGHFAPLSVP